MFLNNLKKIRNEKGLKAQQLADMTGLSLRQIQRYDKGDKEIPIDNVLLLSQILDCSPTDILPNYNKLVSSSRNLKKLEIKINSLSNILDNKTTNNEETFNDEAYNIGNNLKKIREEKGLSMEDVAKKLETVHPQISRWGKNKRIPTLDWIFKLAKVLDCTPAEIIGYENLGIPKTETNESLNNNLDTDVTLDKDIFPLNILTNSLINTDDENSINIPYIDESFQGDTISPKDKDIKKYVKINKEIIKSFIKNYKSLLLLKADECIITSFHFKKGLFLLDCENTKINNKVVQVFAFILEDMIRVEPLIYNDKKDLIETKINNTAKDFVIDLKINTDFEVIGKAVASFNWF